VPTFDFNEKRNQRGSVTSESGTDYTRVYQCITDVRATEVEVRDHVIVTEGFTVGSAHPDDPDAFLKEISLTDEADDGLQWLITIEWKTPGANVAIFDPNPLTRPPEYEWAQNPEIVAIFKDFTTPTPLEVKNSAGQRFEELPQREKGTLSVTVVRNETTVFFRTTVLPLMAYDFVVNSAGFNVDAVAIPALYARLAIRSAPRITEGTFTYYRVTYEIQFRTGHPGFAADGWRERYLDRGYEEFDSGPDTLVPIRDGDGQPVSKPWPLDGAGNAMTNSTDAPAVLGPYKLYPEVAFAPLAFT
jgi:hypothetical protein